MHSFLIVNKIIIIAKLKIIPIYLPYNKKKTSSVKIWNKVFYFNYFWEPHLQTRQFCFDIFLPKEKQPYNKHNKCQTKKQIPKPQ